MKPPPVPITVPEDVTLAMLTSLVVQDPPETEAPSVIDVPSQNGLPPEVMLIVPAVGNALIVISAVSKSDPQVGVDTV